MEPDDQPSSDTCPLSYALRRSWALGYRFSDFKNDAVAALVVSLVALPLAMALSIAVGLPPQHGLYTAIVAGMIVPLLGGSVVQVSGPTAAFVVIVAPIVTQYGLHGLIITEILAGFMLMFLGLAKLGRYIHFVPYPVVTGFTSGIAVVIGTLALNDLFGLGIAKLQGDYIDKVMALAHAMPTFYWPEATIGLVSLMVMFCPARWFLKIPTPIVGIAVGTLLAILFQHYGYTIATIGSRFTFQAADGSVGHGLPPFAPVFHIPAWPGYGEIKTLLVPAMVIASLGALESLLSATVADGIAGTKHQPNSELLAIGIGNILSGLAMGIPATGAIARTATNIHSGAKTPLASSLHALLILFYVLLLAPFLSMIPMSALAALLVIIAYRMSHYKQFIRILRIAPRSDSVVLLVCFTLTVFVDMVAGVTAGIVLASFLFARRIAELTHTDISTGDDIHHRRIRHLHLPNGVMIYHISGSLFFGTVEKALDRAHASHKQIHTLIIDMEDVPLIDMTGLVAMKTLILEHLKKNRRIMLCGNEAVTGKIVQKLSAHTSHTLEIFTSIESAFEACRTQ